MQQGAFNYLLKPLDLSQLRAVAEKAAASLRLRRQNAELNRRLDEKFGFEGVVGNSPQMHDVIDRLKRIAPTDASVLIQGETGTGKELVAQAIHQNSPRKNKPFVALNCAALSENILESELFGHVRGAFTDASSDRIGKFEYANGGTLFLDEVGDMPLATQIKLLRVLESSEITRVGSNEPIRVNVRILSATNRDLEEAIAAGTFRSDLYHRLKVVTIELPRLAERSQDIPLLIEHFLQAVRQAAPQDDQEHVGRGAAAADGVRLAGQRAAAAQRDREHGRGRLRRRARRRRPAERAGRAERRRPRRRAAAAWRAWSASRWRRSSGCSSPKRCKLTGGNREEAAEMLGIGERTLYRKIKEYRSVDCAAVASATCTRRFAAAELRHAMTDIRQLPPSVVNKIAAGEVIERPASVVKELLENAVDAGATRIDVAVEQGGLELVRVGDDGCGIAADELPLAVASHATSKIRDADDLFRVGTLGFRGEALASIAEVSRLVLRSRTRASDAGAELEVAGGHAPAVGPCGCPVGTTIEVRNLFFNTPVRRKFLRSTQTEMGHVGEAFTRLALAHPHVHCTLTHNGRPRVRSAAGGRLARRGSRRFSATSWRPT